MSAPMDEADATLIKALLRRFLRPACAGELEVRQAGGGHGKEGRMQCACGRRPPHHDTLRHFADVVLARVLPDMHAKHFVSPNARALPAIAWWAKEALGLQCPSADGELLRQADVAGGERWSNYPVVGYALPEDVEAQVTAFVASLKRDAILASMDEALHDDPAQALSEDLRLRLRCVDGAELREPCLAQLSAALSELDRDVCAPMPRGLDEQLECFRRKYPHHHAQPGAEYTTRLASALSEASPARELPPALERRLCLFQPEAYLLATRRCLLEGDEDDDALFTAVMLSSPSGLRALPQRAPADVLAATTDTSKYDGEVRALFDAACAFAHARAQSMMALEGAMTREGGDAVAMHPATDPAAAVAHSVAARSRGDSSGARRDGTDDACRRDGDTSVNKQRSRDAEDPPVAEMAAAEEAMVMPAAAAQMAQVAMAASVGGADLEPAAEVDVGDAVPEPVAAVDVGDMDPEPAAEAPTSPEQVDLSQLGHGSSWPEGVKLPSDRRERKAWEARVANRMCENGGGRTHIASRPSSAECSRVRCRRHRPTSTPTLL